MGSSRSITDLAALQCGLMSVLFLAASAFWLNWADTLADCNGFEEEG